MIDLNLEEMMTESDSDLLADIPREGKADFSELDEQDAPVDSPAENAEEEQAPSQEGVEAEESPKETEAEDTPDDNKDVPFHKNPRWQRLQDEKKALEARVAELAPLAEKVKELDTKVSQGTTVPPQYQKVFGDNVEAYNNWKQLEEAREAELEQKFFAKLEQKQKAEAQALEEQQQAIQANIEHIEDTFSVKLPQNSSLRNEFIKFMWDHQPTKDGNLNFVGGWELFSKLRESKPTTNAARKKVVAKTAPGGKTEAQESDVYELGSMMPNQFKQF